MSPVELGAPISSRRGLIRARLLHVRGWLDSTLERIPADLVDWAPAEGMGTIGGQLVEIAEIEIPLVPRLREGRHPGDDEIEAAIGDPHRLEGLKRVLADVRRETLGYLDSLSDEELSQEIPTVDRYYGTLWLPTMPRAEHFLNVAEHEFYHVGQPISYLWARGDDPYRW